MNRNLILLWLWSRWFSLNGVVRPGVYWMGVKVFGARWDGLTGNDELGSASESNKKRREKYQEGGGKINGRGEWRSDRSPSPNKLLSLPWQSRLSDHPSPGCINTTSSYITVATWQRNHDIKAFIVSNKKNQPPIDWVHQRVLLRLLDCVLWITNSGVDCGNMKDIVSDVFEP